MEKDDSSRAAAALRVEALAAAVAGAAVIEPLSWLLLPGLQLPVKNLRIRPDSMLLLLLPRSIGLGRLTSGHLLLLTGRYFFRGHCHGLTRACDSQYRYRDKH